MSALVTQLAHHVSGLGHKAHRFRRAVVFDVLPEQNVVGEQVSERFRRQLRSLLELKLRGIHLEGRRPGSQVSSPGHDQPAVLRVRVVVVSPKSRTVKRKRPGLTGPQELSGVELGQYLVSRVDVGRGPEFRAGPIYKYDLPSDRNLESLRLESVVCELHHWGFGKRRFGRGAGT